MSDVCCVLRKFDLLCVFVQFDINILMFYRQAAENCCLLYYLVIPGFIFVCSLVSVHVADWEGASGVEDLFFTASTCISDSHSGALCYFALCVP